MVLSVLQQSETLRELGPCTSEQLCPHVWEMLSGLTLGEGAVVFGEMVEVELWSKTGLYGLHGSRKGISRIEGESLRENRQNVCAILVNWVTTLSCQNGDLKLWSQG